MAKPTQVVALVQYIVLRGDLVDKWPLGALIAQACHASSAALHLYRDDTATKSYLEDVNSMHKVVLRVMLGWKSKFFFQCVVCTCSTHLRDCFFLLTL